MTCNISNTTVSQTKELHLLLHLNPLQSYSVPVCTLVWWVSYSRTCKTDSRGDAERVILRDNVRNMKKAVDDMEVPSMGCVSHTLLLAVHEGLLSQCCITDSPANTRKVVGQCWNSLCRIIKSHMKVYTLFQQNKNKKLMNAGTFFLNAAVLSRKILVKAAYRINTWYREILNI